MRTEKNKTSVVFDLTEENQRILSSLAPGMEPSDILYAALDLLEIAAKETVDGRIVASVDEQEGVRFIPRIAALQRAAEHPYRYADISTAKPPAFGERHA
jgi:hypothetical protein